MTVLRVAGWFVVALLLVVAVCAGWWNHAAAVPEPSAKIVAQFPSVKEELYSEWLRDLGDDITRQDPGISLSLIGAPPGQPAIVLAQPADDNGNSPAANWPAPWPAVQTQLKQTVKTPVVVEDTYAGVNRAHRLIPLDHEGRLCLVLSRAATPSVSYFWRGLSAAGALGLAALLLAMRGE